MMSSGTSYPLAKKMFVKKRKKYIYTSNDQSSKDEATPQPALKVECVLTHIFVFKVNIQIQLKNK